MKGKPMNVAADVEAGLMTRLEAFADAFERLARSPEQAALASQFAGFVAGEAQACIRHLTDRAVEADRANPAGPMPSPSDVLDAMARGMNAKAVVREYFPDQAEHVSDERLGELEPMKTPSRER